ncbi:MAG: hypothetical protein ACI9WC_001996 [Arenicella sp.]
MIETALTITTIGLLFDAVGVTFLAISFYEQTPERLALSDVVKYYGNQAVLRNLCIARTDGLTGTVLLVLGFMIQFIGQFGFESEIVEIIFVLGLIVFLCGYRLSLRQKFIDAQYKRGFRNIDGVIDDNPLTIDDVKGCHVLRFKIVKRVY